MQNWWRGVPVGAFGQRSLLGEKSFEVRPEMFVRTGEDAADAARWNGGMHLVGTGGLPAKGDFTARDKVE